MRSNRRSLFIAHCIVIIMINSPMTLANRTDSEDSILDLDTARLIELARAARSAPLREQGDVVAEAVDVARARLDRLLRVLENHPETLLRVGLTARLREGLPAEVAELVEAEEGLEGTAAALIADDFDAGRARFIPYIDVPGRGLLRLHVVGDAAAPPPGSRVKVRGYVLREDIVALAENVESLTPPPAPETLAAQVKNAAIILFNFQNNTSQPWTTEYVNSVAFNGPASAKVFYDEASFSLLSLTGNTFGWYTIPYDNTSCGSMYPTWAAAARNAAQAAGADLSRYTNFVYVFPSTPNCPGVGWAFVNGTDAYLQGSYYNRVIIHELGHNFGTRHASSYACTDASGQRVTLSGSCARNEYGDPFDVMGASTNQFNNFHKGQAGWLAPANTLTVTAEGDYGIAPIETATSGVQALRIPRGGSDYFYLEFRQPSGAFDTFSSTSPVVNGVSIRLAPDYPTLIQSLILDMDPATTSFGDAPLPVGRRFVDPVSGIAIDTLSAGPSGATVHVSYGAGVCTRGTPGISISPPAQWGFAGQVLTYALTLRNNDSVACGSSGFTVTPAIPAAWSQVPALMSETLSPGQAVTRSIDIVPPAGAPDGLYTFTETITNDQAPNLQSTVTANANLNAVDVTPPAVAILNPLDGDVISRRGGGVRISVSATDTSGIAGIRILVDGVLLQDCPGATTCSARWALAGVAAGAHTIEAVATDASPAAHRSSTTITVTRI